MNRILLYYPSINIPNGTWLRNSLLYTDKVASIFPFENINDVRINDDTRLLYDEGQYQPIIVFKELDMVMDHSNKNLEFEKFEENFINAMKSKEFMQLQNNLKSYDRYQHKGFYEYGMYMNKLTYNARNYLSENNLFMEINPDEAVVEKISAIVYMSMLANYLACVNKDFVIPSTDDEEYEKIAFQLADNKVLTFKIILDNCLPTPSPDTSIKDIIKFKKDRHQELLQFRIELDKIEGEINSTTDENDRKRKMVQFQEKVQKEIMEIKKMLGDSRLDYVLNGFSSLLDFKQPESIGTITAAAGVGTGALLSLPLIGVGALILIGTLVSSYKKINRTVKVNSSSYIYYAQKLGILNS